jgi:SHS2 domain-containing protein
MEQQAALFIRTNIHHNEEKRPVMRETPQGFMEIEHTADWALEVWAPDHAELFRQAAIGMNQLSELELDHTRAVEETIELSAMDIESLLVSFLSELVFLAEQDDLGFNSFVLKIDQLKLHAKLTGGKILSRKKEIKAVTYHNLEVIETEGVFQVVIVFDV